MKKFKLYFLLMVLSGTTLFTGCNKSDDDPDPTEETTPVKQNDQQANAEVDNALEDVNDLINNKIGGGSNAKIAADYELPCGVVEVDSTTTLGVYKLTYGNQTACGYKYKSGIISFTRKNGTTFNEAGAEFVVTFTNYTVQSNASGNIIKLNGSITVTNVDGGYIWQLTTGDLTTPVKHKIRGTINITYANGEIRERKYFQMRTWSGNGWANLTLTIAGDTTILGNAGYSELGKTLDNSYDYATQITTDFVWTNCGGTWAGPYKLTYGDAKMNVTIPLVTTAYIQVTGGYKWDYTTSMTPVFAGDCNSNAYKIYTVIDAFNATTYQLY